MPSEAEITLKGNQSKSGQIKAIDGQNLSIQRNGNSLSIPLSQIVNVKFDNQVLVYRSDGRQFHRGEKVLLPRSWEKIPLNAFINQEVNDRSGEATTLNNIGMVYQGIGQPQEALKYLKLALHLA